MSLLLLFVLALLTTTKCDFSGYVPYDYCDPNLKLCQVPLSHTMCLYPVAGLSQDCLPNIHKPLTPAEKLQVLSLHNKLRSRVASGEEKTPLGALPAASNMLQLKWDVELETIAERWATRCFNVTVTKIHDDCRNTKRFKVTQNIGTIGSKGTSAEKQIIQVFYHWYMKSKSFDPKFINAYVSDDNKTSEEFVNLIWADTYALGCANVIFRNNLTESQNGDKATPWTFERIVCNYGPGGIILGKPVYKTGLPCSECPTGWSCSKEYNGLCVLEENSKPLMRITTDNSFTVNVKETPLTQGVSSTFRYQDNTRKTSESNANSTTVTWSFSTAYSETEMYNIKLRIGIYYNGVCHCPDISRYGFERSEKNTSKWTAKLEKLKSLIIRSVGNVIPHQQNGRPVLALKNGDRCYCKTSVSNAGYRYATWTLLQRLTLICTIKLLIYLL